MIIQCDKCDTKFKLDDSQVKGKGVKVKCTKCQNVFVVMPQAAPAPAPEKTAAEDLGLAADKDEAWGLGGGSNAAESKASGFGADFDFGEDEKPAPPKGGGLDDEFGAGSDAWGKKAAPSKDLLGDAADDFGLDFGAGIGSEKAPAQKTDAADDFGDFDFGTGKGGGALFGANDKATDKGDGFGDFGDIGMDFGKAAEPAEAPAAPVAVEETESFEPPAAAEASAAFDEPEIPGEGPAEAGERTEEAAEKSTEIPGLDEQEEYLKDIEGVQAPAPIAKKGGGAKKAVLAAVLIIVAIGAGLHLTGILDMLIGPKTAPKAATIAFEDLKGFYVENQHAGKLFAIEGKVKNVSDDPQEVAGVMASVYNKGGDKVISKTVSLGAMMSSEELKTLAAEDITKHFQEVSKGSIPPRGSSPVMFVFTSMPEGLAEFDVEVLR